MMLVHRLALAGRDLDDARVAFVGRAAGCGAGGRVAAHGRRHGRSKQRRRNGKRGSLHAKSSLGLSSLQSTLDDSCAMP